MQDTTAQLRATRCCSVERDQICGAQHHQTEHIGKLGPITSPEGVLGWEGDSWADSSWPLLRRVFSDVGPTQFRTPAHALIVLLCMRPRRTARKGLGATF